MQVRRDRTSHPLQGPGPSIPSAGQQSRARRSVGARCLPDSPGAPAHAAPGLVRGQGLASAASPARESPGPPLPGGRAPPPPRAPACQQGRRRTSRTNRARAGLVFVRLGNASQPVLCVSVCVSRARSQLHPRALAQLAAAVPELDIAAGLVRSLRYCTPRRIAVVIRLVGWLVGAMSWVYVLVRPSTTCVDAHAYRYPYQGLRAYGY